MSKQVSTAIVGLGRIGTGFDLQADADYVFTHTRAAAKHPRVDLVAGIDVDPAATERFRSVTGCQAYSSYAEFLAEGGTPDIVIISTPATVRSELVREVVESRPGIILLEKPIALSSDEGELIVKCCADAGIPLAVNYYRRFDPAIHSVCEEIRGGTFGELLSGNCLFSGGLLENGSHYLDMAIAMLGMPDSVCGDGSTFTLSYGKANVNFCDTGREIGVGELDFLMTAGRVRFIDYCETYEIYLPMEDPHFARYRRMMLDSRAWKQPDAKKCQYHVMDAVVRALRDGAPLASTGETALDVLMLCERIPGAR